MTDCLTNEGICGRNGEIEKIREFIMTRICNKRSGILYLTGPPGTGKTMSVSYVLDGLDEISKVILNCAKAQTSKGILSSICRSVQLDKFIKSNELEMIAQLTKKFSSRLAQPHVIVLDEMDQLPKSKTEDLYKKIFSWPEEQNSKLILIGIANTVNLTSRYRTICTFTGRDDSHVVKLVFRPYTSKDIKKILLWYLEHDENFEDAVVESKALDMIATKYARENGDIRGALNALRSVIDDENIEEKNEIFRSKQAEPMEISHYPTPPHTPPPKSPCKERRTNITSVVSSIKKRSRKTNFKDDVFPFQHQVVLTCIQRFCSKSKDSSMKLIQCTALSISLLQEFSIRSSTDEIRCVIDNLQSQGLISLKKSRDGDRIILRASTGELTSLIQRMDMILNTLKKFA